MEHVEHRFGPGETINAAIRKYNRQKMRNELVVELKSRFNELNENKVPRVGDTVKIPVHDFGDEPEEEEFVPTVKRIPLTPTTQEAPPTYIQPTTDIEYVDDIEEITLSNPIEFVPSTNDEKAMMTRQQRRELARQGAGVELDLPDTPKKPKVVEVVEEPKATEPVETTTRIRNSKIVRPKEEPKPEAEIPVVPKKPKLEEAPAMKVEKTKTSEGAPEPVEEVKKAKPKKPKSKKIRRNWRTGESTAVAPPDEFEEAKLEKQKRENAANRRHIALRNRRKR